MAFRVNDQVVEKGKTEIMTIVGVLSHDMNDEIKAAASNKGCTIGDYICQPKKGKKKKVIFDYFKEEDLEYPPKEEPSGIFWG